MTAKKKLQALCKVAKSSRFGVKFTERGVVYATDGTMLLKSSVGASGGAPNCVADPETLSVQVKQMTKDTCLFNLDFGAFPETNDSDFDPSPFFGSFASVPNALFHVDPFMLKKAVDAVTQSWEGPKAEAVIEVSYVPGSSGPSLIFSGPDNLAVFMRCVVLV